MAVEVRDVAPGSWLWRQPHPDWEEGADWPLEVASFAVESEGVSVLLDPLAPPPGAGEVWDRIIDTHVANDAAPYQGRTGDVFGVTGRSLVLFIRVL